MAQVFHPSANVLFRVVLIGGAIGAGIIGLLGSALYRSPLVTEVGIHRKQPIPFSHQRHVGGNGIDCRFCHTSVEESNFAGIPSTETCMTCHSQILVDAPMLQPVHESWKSGKPMEWNRVYDLPDFVYFDHSIHIAKGVGCTTCHGAIDEMRLTNKANTLHMSWCLECHKAPQKFLREKADVFSVDYEVPTAARRLELVTENDIRVEQMIDCSICHR